MKKPLNFLFLQAEDIGRHLGCYGDPNGTTPHLDKLASEGVRFEQAFSHSPVCAPSRGGMVCGCYPWTTGQHLMRTKLAEPAPTFTSELVKAGYSVHWPTKTDFNMDPADNWCSSTDFWWDHAPPEGPFFLYENVALTHESRMFENLPSYQSSEDNCPKNLRHLPEDMNVPPYIHDCPESRKQLVKYYDALSGLDDIFGQRLNWLKKHGLEENTVVIFLSDHGRGLPREKRWCYEAGLHLPLIVRWPGQLKKGSISNDLVSWVDIAPTILDLAGVPIPSHYQGQVFLGPNKAEPRKFVFAGRDRMDDVFDKVRTVRDQTWHYIRNDAPQLPYAQQQHYMEQQPIMPVMRKAHQEGTLNQQTEIFFAPSKAPEELYNINSDPHCLNNVATNPEHSHILEKMRKVLDLNIKEFGDLGETDEQDLIQKGIVKETYNDENRRPIILPKEQLIGPVPIPLSLNDL